MEKLGNVLRNKTMNRQTAFKMGIVNVFCIKASTCINKRKPRF